METGGTGWMGKGDTDEGCLVGVALDLDTVAGKVAGMAFAADARAAAGLALDRASAGDLAVALGLRAAAARVPGECSGRGICDM